jgi:two-component system CheB/CheR fusion protein
MSTSLALLLHEFATNSVKYGALANPEGQVTITWALIRDSVEMMWIERTIGLSTEQPTPGFGSFLVEATVRSLGAEFNRSWNSEGVTITLQIPVSRFSA